MVGKLPAGGSQDRFFTGKAFVIHLINQLV
jgi:hypothetical protein